MSQLRIALNTPDQLSYAGLAAYFGRRPELAVSAWTEKDHADVWVVMSEHPAGCLANLRNAPRRSEVPVILVADGVSDEDRWTAARNRVAWVVSRSAVASDELASTVTTAAAEGIHALPAQGSGASKSVSDLRPRRAGEKCGLETREIDVLRLLADGFETTEIASTLSYSERTVKYIISRLSGRLHLRNRSHAVAYAVRTGAI